MPQEDNDERAAFIQSLRDAAAFFEEHPDVPLPSSGQMNVWGVDRPTLAAVVASGGVWQKLYLGNLFCLRRTFGRLEVDFNTSRDTVCRRVVTGTRVVPAQPEKIVEDVRWECNDPILGDADADDLP